ncbi:hypothetical protein OTB20_08475 [Streptomyces sp. H27-H1]|uniref:hypothetical protein n=1 Tax=Streptomyces sp. H27-H1 TaxID=2996461 RepID=UPI0022704D20|nr:hypothetical protein [Streptomyces sp. H27-H1]MCY0926240.1 hypothetical protein [Streptomyces sp. H27-H1]
MTQYRDKDGDVWEDRGERMEVVHSTDAAILGCTLERWKVEDCYGPLTTVNPHADADMFRVIRLELALVLDEMADEVWSPYNYSGVDDDIRSTMRNVFEEKARKLREAAE